MATAIRRRGMHAARACVGGVGCTNRVGVALRPPTFPLSTVARAGMSPTALDALATLRGLGGSGHVRLDVTAYHPVAVVTVSNPGRSNALSCAMMVQFQHVVSQLHQFAAQGGRGVVLLGDGGTFCSGADLRGHTSFLQPEVGAAMNAVMTTATEQLRSCPLISVAAVEGHAVGGGAELATSTDFRIMAADAGMQFVQVTRGVVPGWGGITRLVDIAGRKQALYILASGGRMDARQAAALQLTDAIVEVTPEVTMLHHALAFLRPLVHDDAVGRAGDATSSPGAAAGAGVELVDEEVLQSLKATVARVSAAAGAEEGYQIEGECFRRLWGGPAHLAFMHRFRGRGSKTAAATPPS